MAAAQLAAPLAGVPLYDGVVVEDPYRYLSPAPNQAGSPTEHASTVNVIGSTSPQFVAATTESPPQAQLISSPGAFAVETGVVALTISIKPVPLPDAPRDEEVAGNVYRFAVIDQAGRPVPIGSGTSPTVVLRAPQGFLSATIGQFANGSWHDIPSQPAGLAGIFAATVSQLGDYALLAAPASGPLGLDPTLVVAGVVVVGALLGLAVLAWRRGRAKAMPAVTHDRRRLPPAPGSRRRGGKR